MMPSNENCAELFGIQEAESFRFIADNLSKRGWSWGCVSAVDSRGRTIFVADAYRDDGKRFVAHAEEKLTAFMELEAAIYEFAVDAISTNR